MITFGYNSKFSAPLRALLFVALGVLLIVAKADAMEIVVNIVAALILAAGLVSIFVGFKQKKEGLRPLSFFNAATNVVIAMLLFSFSDFVAGFVSYLIGLLLFGFGLFQIFVLVSARSKVKLGVMAYVTPFVVTAVGALIFFSPKFLGQWLGIVAGVALIAYGLSDLISAFKVRAVMDSDEVGPAPGGNDAEPESETSIPEDVKEVDYEKVDEQ